jgi:hypothetical protein
LAAALPARATVITSGTYEVVGPLPEYITFFFAGGITNIGPLFDPSSPSFGFIASGGIFATVNGGQQFYIVQNVDCPAQLQPGCSHDGPHTTSLTIPITNDASRVLNVGVIGQLKLVE